MALAQDQSSVDDLLDQAAGALEQGDTDGAIAMLSAALDENPDDPVALYLSGKAYEQKGDSASAAQFYLESLSDEPDFPEASLALAKLYANSPELGDPVETVRSLVLGYPDDPRLWTVLGTTEVQAGDIDDALESALTAVSLDVTYAPGHLLLGSLFELSDQNDDALQEYLLIPDISSDPAVVQPAMDRIEALSA